MESVLSLLLFVGFIYLMMRFGCGAHMRSGGCGHSSHHHDKAGQNSQEQLGSGTGQRLRDPVCGMQIESERASFATHYGPKAYYFCSKECYRRFQERPADFVELTRTEKRDVA
jgi:YHS domain-containing protein